MFPALAAFFCYGVIGWFTKNLYPFSAYSMYASVARMRRSHVPCFRVDGERARLSDWVDFAGFDPDQLLPPRTECTLMWQIHEASRWMREHPGDGDVPVEWGFERVEVHDDGRVTTSFVPVQAGRARRR